MFSVLLHKIHIESLRLAWDFLAKGKSVQPSSSLPPSTQVTFFNWAEKLYENILVTPSDPDRMWLE